MFEVYSFTCYGWELCLEAQFPSFDKAVSYAKQLDNEFSYDHEENGICVMYNGHWLFTIGRED